MERMKDKTLVTRSPKLSLKYLKIRNHFHANKPKGLKVAKEDQRLIGLMVNRLDGR